MNKTTIIAFLILTSSFAFDFSSIAKDALKDLIQNKSENSTKDSSSSYSSLSELTVSNGLKEALKTGVTYATKELGAKNGYLNNSKTKIPLPSNLQKAESLIRKAGGGKYADELILSMNDAATKAAPKTADVFIKSIKNMNIDDAKKILAGDETSATKYFKYSS